MSRLPTLRDIDQELARRSLYEFFVQAWAVLEPGRTLRGNWHLGAIAEHMQAMYEGQIRRLIINTPPRSTKTTVATVCGPAWRWIHRPNAQFLCVTHSDDIALRDAQAMRALVESDWYQSMFGPMPLEKDRNQKSRFGNLARGTRVSTATLSSGTGENADHLQIDDPHDVISALSDVQRSAQVEAIKTKWMNRLNDPKTGTVSIIMQRVHENDATGAMLEEGGWEHLVLPMEFEADRAKVTGIGWTDPRKTDGELLDPERFGPAEIAEYRRKGELYYQTQYQQNPAPLLGVIIKRDWIRYWVPEGMTLPPIEFRDEAGKIFRADVVTLPVKFDRIRQSWDCAFKSTKESDFVAGVVGGVVGSRVYFIDGINERLSFSDTVKAVLAMKERQPQTSGIYIEDKANGPAIIDTLSSQVPGVKAVNPEGGKESRLRACEVYFQAGNVYFPHPMLATWSAQAVEQIVRFPQAAHDDLVDAVTQLLTQELATPRTAPVVTRIL